MSGKVELNEKEMVISEDLEDVLIKEVKPIGNGAHVLCPKEHTGKDVYLLVCKDRSWKK